MSTVQGSVRDSVTKALIPPAVVTASPYSVVNTNGTYYFTTPGAAVVSVTASAAGYTPQTASVNVPSSGTVIKNFLLVKSALRAIAATVAKKKAKAKARPAKKAKAAKKPATAKKTTVKAKKKSK